MTTPREVALKVSEEIRRSDGYANLVLPQFLAKSRLSTRDNGHVTDLVYGMQRWRGFIDAVVTECVHGSIRRVDSGVLDLLRLAAYEILIRQEPPHVINEWVRIAGRRFARAKGFVNATLRAATARTSSDWREMVSANRPDDATRSILFSHPEWIVSAYRELVGDGELDALLESNNVPPVPTLIALPGVAAKPDESRATTLSPYGFHSEGGALDSVSGIESGTVRVQDEGSQLAALALVAVSVPVAGERWLDLCAGPGGKTAVLAAFAAEAGLDLMANEIHPHRAELVRRSLRPWGERFVVSERDGRELTRDFPNSFTRILVDAPCTGIGALRRRPESRWRKSPRDIEQLVELQRQLLGGALESLTVGGVAAYVTCSPLSEETTEVVDFVVRQNPDAAVIDTIEVLERVSPSLEHARRGTAVQLYPHRHNTDAMFIQLIRRTR